MRGIPYLLRFFRVVPPVPPPLASTFAVTTGIACVTVIAAPDRAAAAVTPILLLQLFAASSGFAVSARRGHYDLVLAMGHSRVTIALVHWLMSVSIGVGAWTVLAAAEAVASAGAANALRTPGTVVAVTAVSTIAWAANVRSPRYTAAVGWLLLAAVAHLLAAGSLFPHVESQAPAGRLLDGTAGPLAGTLAGALAKTLYPPSLVGAPVGGHSALAAGALLVLGAASMALALMSIHRSDIPLEAAQ